MNKLLIFSFIIIIILILIIIYNYHYFYNNFIEGAWLADDDFCELSGIDGMIIYFGDGNKNKKCYMIIYIDDNIIHKNFRVKFNDLYNKVSLEEYSNNSNDFDDMEPSLADLMPLNLFCKLNITDGKMIWYDDEATYAELYKDNIGTKLGKN